MKYTVTLSESRTTVVEVFDRSLNDARIQAIKYYGDHYERNQMGWSEPEIKIDVKEVKND